jgi:hypothetical protein
MPVDQELSQVSWDCTWAQMAELTAQALKAREQVTEARHAPGATPLVEQRAARIAKEHANV